MAMDKNPSLIEYKEMYKDLHERGLLNQHGLNGVAYNVLENIEYQTEYKRIRNYNLLLSNQWNEIKEKFASNQLKVAPLKGIYLLKEIYADWGERKMSDIDILVDTDNLHRCKRVLSDLGWNESREKKWSANNYKYTFTKIDNLVSYTLELHTDLYWHKRGEVSVQDFLGPYSRENHFLFLCYHLCHQHTFLSLFWLHDIFLYWQKFEEGLDKKYIFALAKRTENEKSLWLCTQAVNKVFGKELIPEGEFSNLDGGVRLANRHLTKTYLLYPKNLSLSKIIIKNFCKDRLKTSLAYFFGWIFSKIPFV